MKNIKHDKTTGYSRLLHRGWLYFVLYACVMTCAGCISEDMEQESESDIKTGDMLPDFTVTMNDGTVMTTEALRGKPSCIVFFNTSCADCREELPVLENVFRTYGTDGRVSFVLISREETVEPVAAYWSANGLTMPYSAQSDRSVYRLFATVTIPRVYLSDGNLKVHAIYTDSPLASEEVLSDAIQSLLYD